MNFAFYSTVKLVSIGQKITGYLIGPGYTFLRQYTDSATEPNDVDSLVQNLSIPRRQMVT